MEKAKAATFPSPAVVTNSKARLLDQVREVIQVEHYSFRIEETYSWDRGMGYIRLWRRQLWSAGASGVLMPGNNPHGTQVPKGRPIIAQCFNAGTTANKPVRALKGRKKTCRERNTFCRPWRDSFPSRSETQR
jgi:hypothetical protein